MIKSLNSKYLLFLEKPDEMDDLPPAVYHFEPEVQDVPNLLLPRHNQDNIGTNKNQEIRKAFKVFWIQPVLSWRKAEDERRWLKEMFRRRMHRKEAHSASTISHSSGGSGGAGFSGLSTSGGGLAGVGGGGGVLGGNKGGSTERDDMDDMDEFACPDSPTQQWLADNADLSPLQVRDISTEKTNHLDFFKILKTVNTLQ